MVRLKDLSHQVVGSTEMFQFQYGTIKRHYHYVLNGFKSSFNSNMVRLKVLSQVRTTHGGRSFNSNMVRLKENIYVTRHQI